MKIEALTQFKDEVDGLPVTFELGDVCTVPDADGERFCAAGWAKDTSGAVATGEPTGGAAKLEVHNSTLGTSSTKL